MSTQDQDRTTQAEVVAPAYPMTGADRARFWASLNRFLGDADSPRTWAPAPATSPVLRRGTDDHE